MREREHMRKALFAIVAVAMLVFAGAAMAGKVGQAKPWVYDPDNTHSVVAAWTKDGLSLQKNAVTTTNASAGAEFKGVAGETMTKLSFQVKNGTYCLQNRGCRFELPPVHHWTCGKPPLRGRFSRL
jgi:hypothetical protein